MLKIGLTGGIGSGKTTAAKIFEVLGIPVYYADEAAKRIMNEDEGLKQSIIKNFGDASYADGFLDRSYIAGKVFGNKDQLALLNSLVHPATIHDSEQWMLKQQTPYAIKEAALIFESGMENLLDYIIGVEAPEDIRIARTMHRDHISREAVVSRIKNQMNEEKKIALCDFVLYNNEQDALLPQVLQLHQKLLSLADNISLFCENLRDLRETNYFSAANASLIRTHAFSILGMLFANENRTQAGSPKASPMTDETCAALSRYIEKSAEFLITSVPFDLP